MNVKKNKYKRGFLQRRLEKLDHLFDDITDKEVNLKKLSRSDKKDHKAEIRLRVPHSSLYASGTAKTYEAAVDQAAEGMRKQLEKYKGKVQRER